MTTINFKDGINAKAHRKEDKFQEEYLGLVVVNNSIKTAVNLRIYGTQSRNYCCLWLNDGVNYASGSDYAGGYGYHRPSAAAAGAIEKAGVNLSKDISGRGSSAIEDAVMSMLNAMYPDAQIKEVIKSHG